MDFKELEAFVAVAEELHFGRAAERLHITQPPLSQRMISLERQLGFALFDRSTRNVERTAEAEALLPAAQEALEAWGRFRSAARSIRTGESGQLRIGFAGASSSQVLPLLTRDIRAAYQDIEFAMNGYVYASTAQELILNGKLDLAFSRLPLADARLGHLRVDSEELLCALPDTHPLADTDEIDLKDLAKETFITFPADTGSTLHAAHTEALSLAGISSARTQVATDSYVILSLVAAGAGVALTLSSVRHIQTVGVVYKPLKPPKKMLQSVLIWDKSRKDQLLRNAVEVCAETLKNRPSVEN